MLPVPLVNGFCHTLPVGVVRESGIGSRDQNKRKKAAMRPESFPLKTVLPVHIIHESPHHVNGLQHARVAPVPPNKKNGLNLYLVSDLQKQNPSHLTYGRDFRKGIR